MKKRFACLMLAIAMLIGLIPAAAVSASAASASVSEAGVKVIKESVGFHSKAYEVSTGVYKIGYGTAGTKDQTITEANADKLLREELSKCVTNVTAAMGSVALTQKRMDALVWLAYTEGNTSWSAKVSSALNGSASDIANAICTFDMSGSFANDKTSYSTLSRRMAIANLFLNGTYSASATGNLGYTVFYSGNESVTPKYQIQVFSTAVNSKIAAVEPTFSGNEFLGWYSGNTLMTGVGSATASKVLTAHWQETGKQDSVAANYTLPAYVIYEARGLSDDAALEVVSEAGGSTKVDEITRDSTVTVVAEKMIGSAKWVKLSTGGWVKLYDDVSKMPVTIPATTVTITDDYVNIREKASASSAKVGTFKRGEQVTIAMTDASDKWGYCSKGWIFLAYTSYDQKNSSSSTLTGGTSGKVSGAEKVNVRTAPGVGNPVATQLSEGTAVTVYEQTTVNNASWGHIDQGWISMGYVTLNESKESGSSISTGSSAVVSSSVNLNVRSGPGSNYTKVATLAPGTSVVILRKETVNGVAWGLIDQGWINLNYVSATASSSGSTGYGVSGTVVNCSTGVNIRSAAGTTNALVGVAALGSRVTVTERVQVNGYYWGHIDRGWVCMDYIQLDSEFVDQTTDTQDVDNVVATFQGYPAVITGSTAFDGTTDGTKVYASATYHSDTVMTLNKDAEVSILALATADTHMFGKITVGSKTGWVNMDDVTMKAFNAKVTATKADAYEEPSTRSQFYASLVKGTYVTIGTDGSKFADNWQLSDNVLWGKISVSGHTAWIKLSDVTMFKENALPTGITSLNGVGYMTGTLTADAVVYVDNNGSVAYDGTTNKASAYTLPAGSTVNVQARVYGSTEDAAKTYAKVAVGSVVGWIEWDLIALDPVEMKAGSQVSCYESAAVTAASAAIPAGTLVTIEKRSLVPDSNEINHGITDMGYGYIGDDMSTRYWFCLDDGKLVPTGTATQESSGNPAVATGVVVTGTAKSSLTVYEEAMDGSAALLTISSGTNVTVLNWKIVDGTTWGKVQVNKIVGWVKTADLDFSGLQGTVQVEQLNVYNMMDKTSSVQVLRVNNLAIDISNVTFDGTTLWGQISVGGYNGYIDLSNVKLNTPNMVEDEDNLATIAKAKINSVNASINVESGDVKALPKGTEVELSDIDMKTTPGKALWRVQLGSTAGWIDMENLTMYNAVATVAVSSSPIYDDLTCAKTLYTLYRNEQITVISFKVNSMDNGLYGEVSYGNTTGWIKICDAENTMCVALTPGSTGSTIGGNTGSSSTAGTTATTATTASGTAAYIVCSSTVNVRSGAGVDKSLVTTLANGTNVTIYETTTVLGKEWARIDQGWVCMDYVKLGTLTKVDNGGTNGKSGTVAIVTTVPSGAIAVGYATQDIKVRSGCGWGYAEVATVSKNSSVVIYESKLDGGTSWGRTDSGWLCISYLTITGIGASGTGTTGTISGVYFTANVRGTSSSNGALMAKVMITSKVQVLETATVGSETWVRTALGWINGQYVTIASSSSTSTSTSTAANTTTATDAGTTSDGYVG